MEALRDIKGLVEISDVSWLWTLLLGLGIILLGVWCVWKMKQTQKVPTLKEKGMRALKAVRIDDAKACAYTLTQWGDHVVNAHNQGTFEVLKKMLSPYKYKAYDAPLSEEEKELWEQFLGSCDVHI